MVLQLEPRPGVLDAGVLYTPVTKLGSLEEQLRLQGTTRVVSARHIWEKTNLIVEQGPHPH